jgi:hypothetical protein
MTRDGLMAAATSYGIPKALASDHTNSDTCEGCSKVDIGSSMHELLQGQVAVSGSVTHQWLSAIWMRSS